MPIDRRGFLFGVAALAAAPHGSSASPSDTNDIRLSVATYSLRSFQRDLAIKMVKDLNVEYVDVKEFHLPYNDTPKQLAAGRKKFDQAGLKVIGGGNIDMKSDSEEELRKSFDYARDCGFPMMIIAPSRTNMGKIEKLAKEYNMKVAVHNHGPEDKLYPTPQSVLEIVKDMDPLMGLCIDCGHTARAGKDVVESIAEAGSRVHEMHVKDLKDFKDKGSQVPVGEGIMPIPAIFRQLNKMNYPGVCSLEYEIDVDSPLMGMAKSFSYMRGVMAGMKA